ncbi:MAG: DUF3060 domain-containing protein [Cardiobacteriaceae bacterium]|nr:DUF3060 domain-containing protein [Cardiobacteriaceae bacterium]
MKTTAILLSALATSLATSLVLANDAPVSANGAPVRIDPGSGNCNGQDIHFKEDNFRVILRGECANIVISASNGSVNVEKAQSIRVEGSHVVVLNRDVQVLEVTGNHNTLNMTKVGSADISGSHNGLLGREYGKVTFSGEDNYVNTDNQPEVTDSGRKNRVR